LKRRKYSEKSSARKIIKPDYPTTNEIITVNNKGRQ
jgi:hypothetical protein